MKTAPDHRIPSHPHRGQAAYGVMFPVEVGLGLEPQAWRGKYPAQVRVEWLCRFERPLPRLELEQAIGEPSKPGGRLQTHLSPRACRAVLEAFIAYNGGAAASPDSTPLPPAATAESTSIKDEDEAPPPPPHLTVTELARYAAACDAMDCTAATEAPAAVMDELIATRRGLEAVSRVRSFIALRTPSEQSRLLPRISAALGDAVEAALDEQRLSQTTSIADASAAAGGAAIAPEIETQRSSSLSRAKAFVKRRLALTSLEPAPVLWRSPFLVASLAQNLTTCTVPPPLSELLPGSPWWSGLPVPVTEGPMIAHSAASPSAVPATDAKLKKVGSNKARLTPDSSVVSLPSSTGRHTLSIAPSGTAVLPSGKATSAPSLQLGAAHAALALTASITALSLPGWESQRFALMAPTIPVRDLFSGASGTSTGTVKRMTLPLTVADVPARAVESDAFYRALGLRGAVDWTSRAAAVAVERMSRASLAAGAPRKHNHPAQSAGGSAKLASTRVNVRPVQSRLPMPPQVTTPSPVLGSAVSDRSTHESLDFIPLMAANELDDVDVADACVSEQRRGVAMDANTDSDDSLEAEPSSNDTRLRGLDKPSDDGLVGDSVRPTAPIRGTAAAVDARRTRVLRMVERMRAFDAAVQGAVTSLDGTTEFTVPNPVTSAAEVAPSHSGAVTLASATAVTGISATLRSSNPEALDSGIFGRLAPDAAVVAPALTRAGLLGQVLDALRGGGSAFPPLSRRSSESRGPMPVPAHVQDLVGTALASQTLGWLPSGASVSDALVPTSRSGEVWTSWMKAATRSALQMCSDGITDVTLGDFEHNALLLLQLQLDCRSGELREAASHLCQRLSSVFTLQQLFGLGRASLGKSGTAATTMRWLGHHGVLATDAFLEDSAEVAEGATGKRTRAQAGHASNASPPPWLQVDVMPASQRKQAAHEALANLRKYDRVPSINGPMGLAQAVRRGYIRWSACAVRCCASADGADPRLPRGCAGLLDHAKDGADTLGRPWQSALAVLSVLRALRALASRGASALVLVERLGDLAIAISARMPRVGVANTSESWILLHVQVGM